MERAYDDELVSLWRCDAHHVAHHIPELAPALVVYDPPWDDERAKSYEPPAAPALLVLTGPRRIGEAVERFGGPTWVFTWDTLNSWQTGPRRPLSQTKQALFYGSFDEGARDRGTTTGARQNARANPSTPRRLEGDKLAPDIWRESLRWLHNPTMSAAGAGVSAERFSNRLSHPARRHVKPLGWMRYLIATCSPGGLVYDPFAGSGTTLLAARQLGRSAFGVEIDPEICAVAVDRLEGRDGVEPQQLRLDLGA